MTKNLTAEERAALFGKLLANRRPPLKKSGMTKERRAVLDKAAARHGYGGGEFLEGLFAWVVILAVIGGIGWFAVVKVKEWTAPPKCYVLLKGLYPIEVECPPGK